VCLTDVTGDWSWPSVPSGRTETWRITLPDSSHNDYDASDTGQSWISVPTRTPSFALAFTTTNLKSTAPAPILNDWREDDQFSTGSLQLFLPFQKGPRRRTAPQRDARRRAKLFPVRRVTVANEKPRRTGSICARSSGLSFARSSTLRTHRGSRAGIYGNAIRAPRLHESIDRADATERTISRQVI
jgi:hypothetical protein